jgi:hypothetical protein
MLDKFNKVWEASPQPDGSYALDARPVADLGPGRPLGYHFDSQGDLIVCDSFKVRPRRRRRRRGLPRPWPRAGGGQAGMWSSGCGGSLVLEPRLAYVQGWVAGGGRRKMAAAAGSRNAPSAQFLLVHVSP